MVLPQATGSSRFWRAAGRTPEPNADAVRLLPAYNYLPHVFGASNWSPAEQGDLQRAVLTVAQVQLMPMNPDRPNATHCPALRWLCRHWVTLLYLTQSMKLFICQNLSRFARHICIFNTSFSFA